MKQIATVGQSLIRLSPVTPFFSTLQSAPEILSLAAKNECVLAGCALFFEIDLKKSRIVYFRNLVNSFTLELTSPTATDEYISCLSESIACFSDYLNQAEKDLAVLVLESGCPDRRGPTCGDTGQGGRALPELATPPSNTGVDELLNSGADFK